MKKTLSVIALLLSLVTVLSFGSVSTFAAESSEAENSVMIPYESSEDATSEEATSEEATSEEATSEEATSEEATSEDATSDDATSDDATSDDATSDDATSDDATSDDASKDDSADADKSDKGSSFPWPLVIFLGLIAVFAVVSFICIKKENKFGLWLKNFYKDYKSELKKITWPSREVTVKSTIVVLVCILVCATVIGLLDFGLGKLVELLMKLAGK